MLLLQPPFDVAERRQSGRNFLQRHARLHRQSRRSAGIGHVVPPCRRQRHAHAFCAVHQIKCAGQRLQINVFGVNIALLCAERQRFQTVAGCLKHGQVRVFGGQQGNAIFRQPLINFGFGAGNVRHAVEPAADVRAHGVVHQRGIGRGNAGQRRQLAEMVHAHFNHGITVVFAQIQQSERQADVVVEIARRGQHRIRAEFGTQHLRQHFLHGRFAAGTGDPEHERVYGLAPRCRQLLQGVQRVGHEKAACNASQITARHNSPRAFGQHVRHKIVRVMILARQCDKQIAFLRLAAVGDDAADGTVFGGLRQV